MSRKESGRAALVCLCAWLLLAGCAGVYQRHGYGENAFYRNPASPTAVAVYLPANAPSISQQFNPVPGEGALIQGAHNGIDLFVPSGTPVIAPADGTVVEVSHSFAYGNSIVIDHGRARQGRRLRTRYLHLERPLVKVGEKVVRGRKIGLSGMSGLLAGFPHLHFEVLEADDAGRFQPRNPHLFWQNGVGRVTCFDPGKPQTASKPGLTYPVPCRPMKDLSP